MKLLKSIFITALTILSINSSFGVDLNYNWKRGGSYHFSAVVNDDVSMNMMGMNVNEKFKTSTDFVLRVLSVDASGNANGILYLTKFNIIDSRGRSLASMSDIPESAVKSAVKVDRKGKFTFVKRIYLITSGSTNVLAYGKTDGNSVAVGGQAGNMKVDAYAEFDPATGKLKTGYSVQTVQNTTSITVKVNEETDMIDVIPYDFLELLAIPEGDVAINDEVNAQAGLYKMKIKVTDMSGGIASLKNTMSTDKSADMFDGNANGKKGDGSGGFGMGMDNDMNEGTSNSEMNMDMGNMMEGMDMNMNMDMDMGEGMGMEPQDQAAMDMSKGMAPNVTCDITNKFNYSKGMFEKVFGTVTTNVNSMGMKMKVVSRLEMRLMP